MKKMKWILGLLLIAAMVFSVATAMGSEVVPVTINGPFGPSAVSDDLTYDGENHSLFIAPTDTEEFWYWYQTAPAEGETPATWSKTLPDIQGKDAATYNLPWAAEVKGTGDQGDAPSTSATTGTISKEIKPCSDITINWPTTAPSKTYDGQSVETYPGTVTVSGGAAADFTVTTAFEETPVIDAKKYSVKATISPSENYKTSNYSGITLPVEETKAEAYSIEQAQLGITWKWDGNDWPSGTISYDAQPHEVTAIATNNTISPELLPELGVSDLPTEVKNQGSYTAKANLYNAPNFKLPDDVNKSFTISPITLSIAWTLDTENKTTCAYSAEDHTIGITATGILSADSETVKVVPSLTTIKNYQEGGYTSEAVKTGDKVGNYIISDADASKVFTISQIDVTLTWALDGVAGTTECEYDGKPHTVSVTSAQVLEADEQTVTFTPSEASITNANTQGYEISATKNGDPNNNYKMPSTTTQTFVIGKAPLTLTWGDENEFTYNGNEQKPSAELTGQMNKENISVNIVGETNANENATATATIQYGEGVIAANYDPPTNLTQAYVIKKAELSATVAWADVGFDGTYDGSEHGTTVTLTGAVAGETPVATATLDGKQTVVNAKEYAVATALTTDDVNKNYELTSSTPETLIINPAPIAPSWATYTNSWVYTGSEIEPEVKMTDSHGNVMTEGADKDFTVSYSDNVIVASKPEITVTGVGNYKGDFILPFTITPKPISDESIIFDPIADEVYTTIAIEPEPVVTDTDELKAAKLVKGEDYTVTYANNVKVSDTTEPGAAQITITGKGNYTGTNGTTFIITRKPVKAISTTVNGPTEDTKRLGGPDSSKYHTITIDAQANEKMTVTIFRDGAVVTALKDFTAGDITIEKDAINGATLDGSGDVTYTVFAEYDDKDNLTTDEKSSRDSKPAPGVEDKFNYDTVAKAITVHPLYNRAAKGVGVTLPEGYRLVKFTSSGAGTDFVATNAASLAAGDHVIPFDVGENPKLNSTAKGGTFTGLYEDYVGNPGKVDKQDILKAKGTIEIISVEPPINDSGRIGNTPNLIFTVKMGADGGYSELANGGVFGTRTLSQGEQQITVAASSLVADGTNTPSLSFDDLEGSATFRSFIFDPVCDEPVLTFEPYAGCYYLMGLAEPYSQIVIEVNGEKVTGSADAFGVFALKMPLTEEGDIISIRVTDLAGNVTTTSYRVGPEIEDATMTAFMAGRVYTNAHGMKGGQPDWTMILTASVDDLKAGNVNVPIIAGNMVSIGTMSVKMDGNNNLSYSYTLEDGVQVLNEKFIANTKLEKDAFIAGLGIEVSPNGTLISDIQKGKVYLSCKMNVKVPAEMLKTTFQTEKIKDSDLKKRYRDIQNGKLN